MIVKSPEIIILFFLLILNNLLQEFQVRGVHIGVNEDPILLAYIATFFLK